MTREVYFIPYTFFPCIYHPIKEIWNAHVESFFEELGMN